MATFNSINSIPLPSTVGTSGKFLQSNGSSCVFSTLVLPLTISTNKLLYSTSSNTVGTLTTVANSFLVTDSSNTVGSVTTAANSVLITDSSASAVPSFSQTLPTTVQTNITAVGSISAQLVKNTSGTVGSPSYTFSIDTATGIYYPATNQMGFSIAGTSVFNLAASAITASQPVSVTGALSCTGIMTAGSYVTSVGFRNSSGLVGTPSYTFTSDTATGTYSPATSQFGISVAGVNAVNITTSSISLNKSTSVTGTLQCSGAFTVSGTSNQVVFGTTNTTTLNVNTPISSRTLTIHDLGGNADVLLSSSIYRLNFYAPGTSYVTYNGGPVLYTQGAVTSSGGIATFYLTDDGTATGTALFTYTPRLYATAYVATPTAINVPVCCGSYISGDLITVEVTVASGTNVPIGGGPSMALVGAGIGVYLWAVGS